MALVLNEEQRLLRDTARDFVSENAPVETLRKLRDERDPVGYSKQLWQQMAELGWAGIILPEEFGGLEFGYQGLAAVVEETGRTLTASPLFATVVLGATTLVLGAARAIKTELLPAVAAGQTTLALALEESPYHDPAGVAMRAARHDDRFRLSGRKTFVFDGHIADKLIVVARTAGEPGVASGLTLFLVDGDANGVRRERTIMVDSRNAANIHFDDVEVDAAAVIGEIDRGYDVLEPVLDRARIMLAAEMLGTATEAFERTVAYLKEREQFGVKIGTFQALKHRAAHLFTELELCRSVMLDACSAIDDNRDDVAKMASLAKTKVGDTLHCISNEAIQMHGGIGMTDEFEIGFFLKRARVQEQALGSQSFHRDRYARLSGY